MDNELQALKTNRMWEVVPCPPFVMPIGSKWVYSSKLRFNRSLEGYKAYLIALSNRQKYDIDYEETFAPVAKMTTVQRIFALAPSKAWPLYKIDVKNAFLYGDLKE